jgi:hypothetical protein
MRLIRFALPSFLLFTSCAFASAQIVQSKAGYLIFVKFKKGQVIQQNLEMQVVENSKLKSSNQFITKCLDVDKSGNSTLEVTVAANGKTPPNKKKLRIDNHGKPIGQTIDGYSGTFAWPDVPMKMGQSWLGDINMVGTGQEAGGAIKSTYKLAGIKTINGVKVASIATVLNVGGSFAISGTGMIYVRFSDGQLHHADFNLALDQFSESGAPKKLKLLMTIRTKS